MENSALKGPDFISIIKDKGFDKALSIAGDFDKYQYKLMLFLGIQWLITSFVLMIQPFLMQTPTFLCQDPNNPGQTFICDENEACKQDQITFADDIPGSIVTEFSLICERSSLRNLCGTIFFFGGSLGTLLFSHAADKYGRKKALLFAYALGSIALLLLGLSAYSIGLFYFFLGTSWAGYDAYFAFSFVLVSEAGGAKLRGISNSFLLIVWGIGLCVFVGIAYSMQNWRTEIIYFIAIPACVSILLFTQIYESPRFLYTKGEYEKCQEVLCKIANENNKIIDDSSSNATPEVYTDQTMSPKHQIKHGKLQSTSEASYLTIFQNSWLRTRFLLFSALIVYLYLSYNGILFALADIGGNIYQNSIVLSAAELLAYIVSLFLLNKLKRKTFFVGIMLSAAIAATIFALIPYISCDSFMFCKQNFLEEVLSLIIKFDVTLSFGLIYVYGSELFPTVARSKCIGLGASLGRGASMLTTWLNHGLMLVGIKPMLFYGSLGFVMLFLLSKLPETFGEELLDNIPGEGESQIEKVEGLQLELELEDQSENKQTNEDEEIENYEDSS